MTFTFSIRTALKRAWQIFKKRPLFFSSLAFVMIIFNLFARVHSQNTALLVIVGIAVLLWSYVWMSVALAAVDGKEATLTFKSLSLHMPNFRQFFMIILVGIVWIIIVALGFIIPLIPVVYITGYISFGSIKIVIALLLLLGFIIFLIPGVYLATRLAFTTMVYVDRQGSVGASLKHSWRLVDGKIFWTVFLVIIVQAVLVTAGAALFMVGLLIAYPLAILLFTQLYRAIGAYYRQSISV